ncbi:acyl-CoA dehydrogenase [bacterium]|nr:acyl-CoA dehydrogenase [bacterium]
MAQQIADRRDVDFVLFEQLEIEQFQNYEKFKDFSKKVIDMVITEARNLSIKEILPTLKEGDREGLIFKDGKVTLPDSYKKAYKLFVEGEWVAMGADTELGGQGLPNVVIQAVFDYFLGANYQFTLYGMSGYGPGEMIEIFGNREQKDLYLKKLYCGEWGGTMVMTEPEAGSDVGAISTTAVRNTDGTYSISGNKIFITNAEHDLNDNIIHPVLARIEGAPKGTKGISLFIVPKIRVNADGSLGDPNDVVVTGLEDKMGMHASATCSVTFGGKGNCQGMLLGDENQGMKIMFHLMNAARLAIGAVGQTSGSAAYLHALNYAAERIQGRDLEKTFDSEAESVTIINHPDVRRMLIWMKAHVEGMRSLLYYGALCHDREQYGETEKEREYYKDLFEILTPVIKSYCTDRGFEVCSEAMQVFGGYGYTKDYPVEQLLRDVRIASIYEGTNGVQAMDLLARKLPMKKGAVLLNLVTEIQNVANKAKEQPALAGMAEKVEGAANRLIEAAMHLGKTAMSSAVKAAFLHAVPFQEVMGDICMAWMLLWRAEVSIKKLADGAKKKDTEFYQGQIKTASYFINSILPVTIGKIESILANDISALEISEAGFGV